MHYLANRHYDPDLDVRDFAELATIIRSGPPHGLLWVVVGARRAGKTWMLEHVKRQLPSRSVCLFDLRNPEHQARFLRRSSRLPRHILLDEPSPLLEREHDREFLAEQLVKLRNADRRLLLAVSPQEWEWLQPALHDTRRWSEKDRRELPPLTDEQARRMAQRTDWAEGVLEQLPSGWRRHACLLELVLQLAEQHPGLRSDVEPLLQAAIDASGEPQRRHFAAVYTEGLSETQRRAVREVAWHGCSETEPDELLLRCGLLAHERGRLSVADPVLAHHLPPPLRLHHISDIHVGPKSAADGDVKATDPTGRTLAAGAGAGVSIRDGYLEHVRSLHGSGRAPHLILCSGDLVEWGTEEQYTTAAAWLGELAKSLAAGHPRLASDSPRVLLVGGNHDVSWNEVLGADAARQRHTRFHEAFDVYPHPRLDLPPGERSLAQVSYAELDLSILLLGSAEFGGELAAPHDPEQQDLLARINALRRVLAATSDEAEIRQLLDRLERIDPGLIHAADLQHVRRHAWDGMAIRIAVLHHPVSPLPVGVEVTHFAGLLNAGQVKDTLLAKGFCLVLHGHVHAGWFGRESWPGRHGDRTLHIAAAPSLGSREVQEHHGFNEIAIYWEGPRWHIVVTRFIHQGTGWVDVTKMTVSAEGTFGAT